MFHSLHLLSTEMSSSPLHVKLLLYDGYVSGFLCVVDLIGVVLKNKMFSENLNANLMSIS